MLHTNYKSVRTVGNTVEINLPTTLRTKGEFLKHALVLDNSNWLKKQKGIIDQA